MRMTRKSRRQRQRREKLKKQFVSIAKKGIGLTAAAMLFWNTFFATTGYAMPSNGKVTAGNASISQNGNVMNINQTTRKAAINWHSFSIAANETVNFNQPNANAVTLNRVIGNNLSEIYGKMNANGKVFLINPNGILFGAGAQVNVGGLLATTHNISDDDFMNGNYNFINTSSDGKVVNQGTIVAQNGGYVALLAPEAINEGIIVAQKGTVGIASANQATFDFTGDGKMELIVDESAVKALAENKGLIEAEGGLVLMTASAQRELASAVVNQSGIIRATSLGGQAGAVELNAVGGTSNIAGTIDVSGAAAGFKGGTVDIFAKDITLESSAQIDASGDAGGGTVRVGGDWQGSGDAPHADNVTINQGAAINADAINSGDGGTVVAWSDGTTKFDGYISAKGGQLGGDGGKMETSGHILQINAGFVNASAANGEAGEWLLDPYSITIDDSGNGLSISNTADSFVGASIISSTLSGGTSVTITTSGSSSTPGDITINESISHTGANNVTLTLQAHNDIIVNKNITSDSTGALNVDLHSNLSNGTGSVTVETGANIKTNGGEVIIHGGSDGKGYSTSVVDGASGVNIKGNIDTSTTVAGRDGGTISIYGKTNSTAAASSGVGITGSVNSGGGDIIIDGLAISNNASNQAAGVMIANEVNAGSGTVDIRGENNPAINNQGITVSANGKITGGKVNLTTDKANFIAGSQIAASASGDKILTVKTITSNKNISIGSSDTGGLHLGGGSAFQGFSETFLGSADNTGTLTVSGVNFGGGNLTLQAGNIAVMGDLTVGQTANLIINNANATSSNAGKITAGTLNLNGSTTAFTFSNTSNAVGNLTGTAKSVNFTNNSDFTTRQLALSDTSFLTANSGDITVADTISSNGANLTLEAKTGTITNAGAINTNNGKLDIKAKTGVVLGSGSTITSGSGNISFLTDSLTANGGTVAGSGNLNIDTYSSNNIGISFGDGVSGGLNISQTAFNAFTPGFNQVTIGGANNAGINVGTTTAKDNLIVTTNSANGITFAGGASLQTDTGKDLTLDAGTINFNDATLSAGKNLSINANALGWGTLTAISTKSSGTGNLFIAPKTPQAITVGGTGYVSNYALGKIAGGGFQDVTIGQNSAGTKTAGAVTVDSFTFNSLSNLIIAGTGTGTAGFTQKAKVEQSGGYLKFDVASMNQDGTDSDFSFEVENLLLNGTGAFNINNSSGNKIKNIAGSVGALALVDSGTDLNILNIATVGGIEGVTASGDIKIITDHLDVSKKLTGNNVTITPKTASSTFEISDILSGIDPNTLLHLSNDDIKNIIASKINLGDDEFLGDIIIYGPTYFTSEVVITTKGDGSSGQTGKVTLSDEIKINDGDGNLTITAYDLETTADIHLKDLILNITNGLGGLEGNIYSTGGELKLGGVGDKNIYITDDKSKSTAGYVILYETLSKCLGFTGFNVKGDKDIYLEGGDFTAGLKLEAGKNIEVTGIVKITADDSLIDMTAGESFTIGDGNSLNMTGNGSEIKIKTETGGVTLGNSSSINMDGENFTITVDAEQDVALGANSSININGPNATIAVNAGNDFVLADGTNNTTDTGGKLTVSGAGADITIDAGRNFILGNYSLLDADNAKIVDITAKNAKMGTDSKINAGGGGFILMTDALIGEGIKDSTAKIEGDGSSLTLKQKTATGAAGERNLHVIDIDAADIEAYGNAKNALVITNNQLNGDLFGTGFGDLILGNEKSAGTVLIEGLKFNKSVTIQTGATGKIDIGTDGLTIQNSTNPLLKNTLTLRGGTITNYGNSIDANAGIINFYADNLFLTNKAGVTGTVNGAGTIGIATWGGSKSIYLGTGSGGLVLGDDLFSDVLSSTFTQYNIGNSSQGNIYVNNSNLERDTTLTAQNIYFTDSITMDTDKTLTVNALTKSEQTNTNNPNGFIKADNLLLLGGNHDLTKSDNQIKILAANANQVKIKADTLTIGEVNGTTGVSTKGTTITGGDNGSDAIYIHTTNTEAGPALTVEKNITANSGNITLISDTMDFADSARVTGSGNLTVMQHSANGTMGIGDGAAGKLNLDGRFFNDPPDNATGRIFTKGFSNIYLGRTDGTGDVTLNGTLNFADSTTIRTGNTSGSVIVESGAAITSEENLEFKTWKFITKSGYSIYAKKDFTLTVDNLELTEDAGGQYAIRGDGNLILQTYTDNWDIYLDNAGPPSGKNGLWLKSGYFDGNYSYGTGYQIFKFDNVLTSKIIIGDEYGKGTLYQNGTTNFYNEVIIRQAANSGSGGGVNVTGDISTNGKDFSVASKNVDITNANINTGTGNVSLTADNLNIENSTIETEGDLAIKTYSWDTIITFDDTHVGEAGYLVLDESWFNKSVINADSITFGSGGGDINVSGLELGAGFTGKLALESQTGNIIIDGLVMADITLDMSTIGGKISGAGTQIENLGDVTAGQEIIIDNIGELNINGAVKGKSVDIWTKGGNLTIGQNGNVKSTGGDIYLTAELDKGKGGHFINKNPKTSSEVLDVSTGNRWVIFTEDSTGNDYGNLDDSFRRYGTVYGDKSDLINGTYDYSGSGFAYNYQPTITVYSYKTYGDGVSAFFTKDGRLLVTMSEKDQLMALADNYGSSSDDFKDIYNYTLGSKLGDSTADANSKPVFDGAGNLIGYELLNGAEYYGSDYGDSQNALGASYNKDNALNYKIDIQMEVRQKEVTVTAAQDAERTYDGTSNGNSGTVSYAGFISGQNAGNAGITGNVKYDDVSKNAVNAGTYELDIQNSDLSSNNYYFVYENGELNIKKRQVTVSADNYIEDYNGNPWSGGALSYEQATANGTGGYTSDTGFVGGDTAGNIGLSGSITYTSGAGYSEGAKNAGDYYVNIDNSANQSLTSQNYEFVYVDGTLKINKKLVTVTADSHTKTYDGNAYYINHDGYTYDGFVPFENKTVIKSGGVSLSGSADGAIDVGSYAINVNGDLYADNYEFDYVSGVLTVRPNAPNRPLDAVGAVNDITTINSNNSTNNNNSLASSNPNRPGSANPTPGEIPQSPIDNLLSPSPATEPAPNPAAPVLFTLPDTLTTPVADLVLTSSGTASASSFASDGYGFALSFGSAREGIGDWAENSMSGAVPILFTKGGEQSLNGIYVINYDPEKLAILPSSQGVTIPSLNEVQEGAPLGFTVEYKSTSAGNFDVAYENGIVTIKPLDDKALKTVTGKDKDACKAVLANGILLAIEDMGVGPDQLRAIYVFEEKPKGKYVKGAFTK